MEQQESLFLMEAASSCTEQIIPEKKFPAENQKKKEKNEGKKYIKSESRLQD